MDSMSTQIAIVGGGPAGLATAQILQSAGHSLITFDKGPIAAHIARLPPYMTFFSTADLLEIGGFPLIISREKPTRQEYLNYLRRFVREFKLDVRTGHEVIALNGEKGTFGLRGRNRCGEEFEVHAERVVLATGAFDTPRMLDIPGEDLSKVSHYYSEVHSYFGMKVLIIGGKNSAVEAALELWRSGIDVSICHRGFEFGTLKYWLAPDIENRVANGEIKAYRPAEAVEIRPHSVLLRMHSGETLEVANDYVLALTGYRPDPKLLARFGISVDSETDRPSFNSTTLESERPGVYIVGVMLAGNVSGEIFIENSRTHGEKILAHLNNGSSPSTAS